MVSCPHPVPGFFTPENTLSDILSSIRPGLLLLFTNLLFISGSGAGYLVILRKYQ